MVRGSTFTLCLMTGTLDTLSTRCLHRLAKAKAQAKGQAQALSSVCVELSRPTPRGCAEYITSAFGTKILVLHPDAASDTMGLPVFDVKDRSFMFGPLLTYLSCPIYFPIGDDRLFALDIGIFLYCLRTPERGGPWVWHHLPYPPFPIVDVTSYAVQPDGCILVSTKSHATRATATFVFDTKEYVWKPYGDWAFPFTGRGHYDPSLEAFVGIISKHNDPETLGYLCSCTMASTGSVDTSSRLHPSPDWKCSKEAVYSQNPPERHVSATLVHMRQGKFCLVECVSIAGDMADQELRETAADKLMDPADLVLGVNYELWEPEGPAIVPHCGRFMYRVKTFPVVPGANGDLKLKHCRVRCYSLPHEASTYFLQQDPVAFWL